MKRLISGPILILFLLISLVGSLLVAADNGKIRFKAKRHYQDLNNNSIVLEGGVVVGFGTVELRAGKVTVKKEKNLFEATENVVLSIPSELTEISATHLIYNYGTKTGEFQNAFIKSGYMRIRAEKVLKVGHKKYEFYKGSYTTCDVEEGESCPWKIWSHKAKVTIDGYATAEHPVFMISGIPVAYAPFIAFPVKHDRQTGFLMPEFGITDRSGIRVGNSFFLSLGRSHDATLGIDYLSKRGLKHGLEYRFVLDERSHGQFNGFFIRDREFDHDFDERNRFAADFTHQYYFLPNLFNKSSIKIVSDDDYVKDFDEDIEGREDAGLEAKILFGWNFENISLSAEGIYYESLLSGLPRDNNRDITHKLPELRMVAQPTRIWGDWLNFGLETSYVNFANEELDFKDVNLNGIFDEKIDEFKRAHRFDFFPTFSAPFRVKRYFEVIPSLGYRQTHWWMPVGDSHKNRQLVDFKQQIKTNIGKIYHYNGRRITKMKHVIEPTISYNYSPYIRRDETLPSFDAIDDIGTKNVLSWQLQNRFIFKVKQDDDSFGYFDAIRFTVNQDYDIQQTRNEEGLKEAFKPIKSVLTVSMKNFTLSSEAAFPISGRQRVSRISSGFEYFDPFSNSYLLNHTFSREDDHNSINGRVKLGFLEILKFYVSMNYSFDEDRFLEKIIFLRKGDLHSY